VDQALLWLARGTSLLTIGTLALFAFGEAEPRVMPTPGEALLLAFFPIGVAVGLALAWKYERTGAFVALGSLAVFYLLEFLMSGRFPGGPWFLIFTLPALLFLAHAMLRR
jgi:hypothetical protein